MSLLVDRHYNFHGYRHEKQQALEAWGYKLCWLMGHGPEPEQVRQFYEWGFDMRWKNSPWNLEQWQVDGDNVVALSPPARRGARQLRKSLLRYTTWAKNQKTRVWKY